MKDRITNKIFDFYNNSHDFNGMPYWELEKLHISNLDSYLLQLIGENVISVNFTINPHIKQFDFLIDKQLEYLEKNGFSQVCFYPTEILLNKTLKTDKFDNRPFTKMLAYGKPQLMPIFFKIEILNSYVTDPRYDVEHSSDYSGMICYKSETDLEEQDQILLETFGIGYKEEHERVIVVYLRYLSDLTPEHQQRWFTYIEKSKCREVYEYYQNSILGEWAEYSSIYEAFIEELHHINNMSEKMFGKRLFIRDYKDERPEDFRTIFIPTLENYYKFVHVLDKLMSENISKEFFKGKVKLENEIERKDGKIIIQPKGTIKLFEEWLKKTVKIKKEEDFDLIFKPFKMVRKLRQKPAHAINQNIYDKSYFKIQDDLIHQCYTSVRMIRLLFANHPAVKSYKVPDWLYDGKIKTF